MKDGWLWLSILNTTASPSPMSITPAFSPGPRITQGALVGSLRKCRREDLYEQCSFHIAEKTPSSVKLGARPSSDRMRSYSSGFRPWAATSAASIFGSAGLNRAPFLGWGGVGEPSYAPSPSQFEADFGPHLRPREPYFAPKYHKSHGFRAFGEG